MVLAGILAVVAVGCYWHFVLQPRGLELAAVEQHVAQLQGINQRAKAELAKGGAEDLQRQATEYREHLRYMRQLVPTGNEVPALLEQVSTAARRVGLDIAAVQPEPVIEGEEFDTYRYNLTVTGSYHRLGEFMGNVGSLTRIVAPVNVKLTPDQREQPSKKGKREALDASSLQSKFQIQTYVARAGAASHDGAPAAEDKSR
jgi:type IV pilus assembly protein PilO